MQCFCRTAYRFYVCKEHVTSVNKLKFFIADSEPLDYNFSEKSAIKEEF